MENIISIENLIFAYPHGEEGSANNVIDDVTLDIPTGQFVAVIGKNGSGKSTIAKNINGLLYPVSGKITVDGYDTTDEEHIWDVRQCAGMVFQNPDNQIVSAIVEDDVAFGPENLGIDPKKIRLRVDEALESVNMGKYRRKGPHLLSGGQKQRIAIAGVCAMKPKCIIFDEPTAMLDPSGRKDVMKIIQTLNGEGITCVLITHFMEEAAMADRIVIMDEGRVVMDGAPEEVFVREEELRALNLDIPLEVEIANRLRAEGVDVPSDVINREKMVEFLCRYK